MQLCQAGWKGMIVKFMILHKAIDDVTTDNV